MFKNSILESPPESIIWINFNAPKSKRTFQLTENKAGISSMNDLIASKTILISSR